MWRSLLRILFVAITSGKVQLWLWKGLEFFSPTLWPSCLEGYRLNRSWMCMWCKMWQCCMLSLRVIQGLRECGVTWWRQPVRCWRLWSSGWWRLLMRNYIVGHKKEASLLFFWNFKNQQILIHFSLLHLQLNIWPTSPNYCCYTTLWKSKYLKCDITVWYWWRKLHQIYHSFIKVDHRHHMPWMYLLRVLYSNVCMKCMK